MAWNLASEETIAKLREIGYEVHAEWHQDRRSEEDTSEPRAYYTVTVVPPAPEPPPKEDHPIAKRGGSSPGLEWLRHSDSERTFAHF